MTGVIKTLNYERGFGFVTADDKDYFFHRTALTDADLFHELAEGDEMELVDVENAAKGWRVNKLIPVSAPTTAA